MALARKQAGFEIDHAVQFRTGPTDPLLQFLLQGQVMVHGAARGSPASRLLGQQEDVISLTLKGDDVLNGRRVDLIVVEEERAFDQNRWVSAGQDSAPQACQIGDISNQASQPGQQRETVGLEFGLLHHDHDPIEKVVE